MDSGASEYYLDIDFHPGLRERMLYYEILKEPHQIITAGKHAIEGIAKGIITDTFNRQHGEKQQTGVLSNSCTWSRKAPLLPSCRIENGSCDHIRLSTAALRDG